MTQPDRKSLLPVVIGIGVTGVLLFFLAILANARKNVEATRAPALTIVNAEPLDSPLVIRFRSPEPLALRESGWGYRNLHLHASVNGVEYMPAATELEMRDSLYYWTLPAVPRGNAMVYLGWADQAHRPLREGASDTVQFVVR
jgi:hypothetical protein